MIAPAPKSSVSFKTFSWLLAATCALVFLGFIGTAAAPASNATPQLLLTFPTKQAQLSGSRASVWATCQAPEAQVCHGTVTLATSGNKHVTTFSVIAGTVQRLSVPLGADAKAKSLLATVDTSQGNGTFLHSRVVLRLR